MPPVAPVALCRRLHLSPVPPVAPVAPVPRLRPLRPGFHYFPGHPSYLASLGHLECPVNPGSQRNRCRLLRRSPLCRRLRLLHPCPRLRLLHPCPRLRPLRPGFHYFPEHPSYLASLGHLECPVNPGSQRNRCRLLRRSRLLHPVPPVAPATPWVPLLPCEYPGSQRNPVPPLRALEAS